MATLDDITQEVIELLSQVPGTSVQTYSEDRIALIIQQRFDFFLDKLWWPAYMSWRQYTLDGTTGMVTATISDIVRYEDIRIIMIGTTDNVLLELPRDVNPYRLTGTTPRYRESTTTASKLFRALPITSTGTVAVHARLKPTAYFVGSDSINLDRSLLVNSSVWQYLSDDGGNPGQISFYQDLTEARYKSLRDMYNEQRVELDSRNNATLTTWVEVP